MGFSRWKIKNGKSLGGAREGVLRGFFVEKADMSAKQEIENLIEGKTIWKPIHEDITYEDVEMTQNNLWNFLFFTGYLKKINEKQDEEIRYIEMAILNREVRYIYKRTILTWFEEKVEEKEEAFRI